MILNETQINAIVARLNREINLPILGEKAEQAILTMAINKVLNALEDNLPPEFIAFLTTTAEGFEPGSEDALEGVKDNMVKFINARVNLPIIGERAEKRLFDMIVGMLFDAMQKDKKLA